MFQDSDIFEENYNHYRDEIAKIDFESVKDRLGLDYDGERMRIPFFNREYRVGKNGLTDASGARPNYGVCVILAKYVLLCPDKTHHDEEWVSFKDFRRASHFTNTNFFASDTEQAIARHFSGGLAEISRACEALGGVEQGMGLSYDLSMRFDALPRIAVLLLFNDRDEEFPAKCTVLFQRHAEYYLDPESLAMMGAVLAGRLKKGR